MTKKEFDGIIDQGRVKVIIKEKKDGETMFFAKPKNLDTVTPDFRENKQILWVHQDSPDDRCYRSMDSPTFIASGVMPQGKSFVESKGFDIAVLPMKETADGFTANTVSNGVFIDLPAQGYCLMALGRWSQWRQKSKDSKKVGLDAR